jgi:hypothetical protein
MLNLPDISNPMSKPPAPENSVAILYFAMDSIGSIGKYCIARKKHRL